MSQQSKTTLQSAINTQIADNTSGNITAANVRNNLINITDSLLFNTGSQAITGSLIVTGGITGSLQGTASWATNAINATTAATASFINGTNTKTYGIYSENYSYPSTASFVRYALPVFSGYNQCTVEVLINKQSDYTSLVPIQVKLYASQDTSSSISAADVLIATYSSSLPSHSGALKPIQRFKRTFYLDGRAEGEDQITEYHILNASPTTSILSDDLIQTAEEQYISNYGTGVFAYYNLKITGQTASGSIGAFPFSLGPVRVTF
jgi:cell division ATPase FtsA